MSEPAVLPTPALLKEPDGSITFTFDGKPISARPNQSIAAAMYAAGIRIFNRSFKYHRPRGLFCIAGECPNCLMHVDGRPNVRSCVEPVREGQVVQHQNAWPSLNFDALRVFDRMDRWLPVGFYYRRFHKPRWLWPIFEHVVRHIAGLGRIDVQTTPITNSSINYLHTQVCVVGAGPAGLAAARSAAEAGAKVLLVDRQSRVGGHLLFTRSDANSTDHDSFPEHSRIKRLSDTIAFGLYEGNMLAACQGERLFKIRAGQIIVCTGGRERPFVFHNNDLPGIFLARGVQRLARLHGVQAGKRAVLISDREDSGQVAEDLTRLGIEIAASIDPRSTTSATSENNPWPTYRSNIIVRAHGNRQVHGVTIAETTANGMIVEKSEREIECDLVCMASTLVPANELLSQAGYRFQNIAGQWKVQNTVPGIWAAGAVAGTFALAEQVLEGKLRGLEAAAAVGYASPQLEQNRSDWQASQKTAPGGSVSALLSSSTDRERKRFICLCEDVTEKDVHQAVAEGFDHVETLKRYSTAAMGPCQGKVCSQTMVESCARATEREIGTVGSTTSRPPAVPIELSVLAAGRHHPVRRTPMHYWHQNANAKWMDAGQWKRPEHYGDANAEVHHVRNGVGLIDVSTLGKIEVTGPDAAEFLERIYLNRWSDLKVGRARYGALCNEDGILFDDGVGARIGLDRFYLTATTGNAESVVQWLDMWQVTWRLKVTILNRTSALGAMNLAGPLAREVLGKVSKIDSASAAFPYLGFREAEVAGIPCRLLRIGFVGELGYEIHCPSSHALELWQTLIEAGAEFGIKPFGVEAQRVLRLEKGHLIIGLDTDALSTPLEAGLEWMVRFDKPVFLGRGPLLRLKEMGPRSHLVGFQMVETSQVAPEGCQVVENRMPVGRVTSTRYSPTLQRSLGLAWVPAARSAPGQKFWIRCNGNDLPALIVKLPFYDPDGKRLKS